MMRQISTSSAVISIIFACLFFGGMVAIIRRAGTETLIYYTVFSMLAIAIFSESLMLVGSVYQLFEIWRRDTTEEGAKTFVLLQLLQAAIVVPVSIGLLILLRGGAVASWIIYSAVVMFSILQVAARRYRLYRAGQAEW